MPRANARGWSPEPLLWTSLAKLSNGLKWHKAPFIKETEHLVPSDRIGVYLVCAETPAPSLTTVGAYTVLYVGSVTARSRSLRQRFREHLAAPKPILARYHRCYFPAVHFWFTPMTDALRASELEALLKTVFNPPCNDINPPGTSFLLAKIEAGTPIASSMPRRQA